MASVGDLWAVMGTFSIYLPGLGGDLEGEVANSPFSNRWSTGSGFKPLLCTILHLSTREELGLCQAFVFNLSLRSSLIYSLWRMIRRYLRYAFIK